MRWHMNIEKTIMELEKHHMQVYFVANAAEAKEKVLSLIPAGATVANGGSMTLVDSGILDAVKSGEYRYLDRNMQGLSEDEKNMRLGEIMTCDYFLSSSNAITESGERRIGGLPGEDVPPGVVHPAGDDVRPVRKPPHRTLHVRQRGVGLRADLHGEKAVNLVAPDVGTEDIPI